MFSASKTAGPSGYNISRSVRLRSSASAYFSRTLTTPTSNTTWSWSGWVKLGQLGTTRQLFGGAGTNYGSFGFESTDQIRFWDNTGAAAATSTAVFRDPSAWYHVVVISNGTTIKAYVNNLQVLSYTGTITNINSAISHQIGRFGGYYTDGYLTEINFIDGQALTPSSFGSTNATTGVWQPAKYTGTYGTNGFYLNFSDNSAATAAAIGKDYSGNGNNWTPNNISVTAGATYDSMIDVPTPYADGGNGRGNYAVLNPLWKGSNITLSGANLDASMAAASDSSFSSTFTITSGKWYWEARITTPSTDYPYIGVATPDFNYQAAGAICIRSSATGFFKASNATKWNTSSSAYGSSFSAGDIMMIAYDADAAKIYFGKNGVWDASSDPATGANPAFTGVNAPVTPAGFVYNCAWSMNFGQRPFTYTPPSGFKALNTYNLPASTVLNGGKYMAATLYTGTLLSNSITNAGGFKPDLVWVKSRSAATDHKLTDSVRGVTKALISNTTGAETTDTQGLTAFNSNGFTVGTNTNYNNLSATYVGWQWQAGQGSTSSNTSGSITSTVSVNATAGFSVVTYTGTGANATVGHGLGVAPKMVIVKARGTPNGTARDWLVWHSSFSSTEYIFLNLTNAKSSASGSLYWNSTLPTSSVFSIGTDPAVNWSTSNNTYVAYCWAEIAGFSKFGSYTGNGSTDGPFVYCGFRPRWVMIKQTSGASDWIILDTSRDPYNMEINYLVPNTSGAEASGASVQLDGVSNGIKIRGNWAGMNASGSTYIFAAFAENPFANALAR